MALDPRHLYRELMETGKQLRELLRTDPLNESAANVLRESLEDEAKRIADMNASFAASVELEQVLWKPCFYKRIEEFRRRIRKYASASSTDPSVREHFFRVSTEFQQFLTASSSFYDHLRLAFVKYLQLHSRTSQDQAQDANAAKCRQSLHHCLIFLGDLARYRELHSQKAKKNFSSAEGFYQKAIDLLPENGNPHNQLAVLATYVDAETVAVYRYCRSLLIGQPFETAEVNLVLLFERNRHRKSTGPSQLPPNASSKDKSAFLKSFLCRLTRLHGILFGQVTTGTNASSNGTNAPSAPSATKDSIKNYPVEMEQVVLNELDSLLSCGAISDSLLLKIISINMFCVSRARVNNLVPNTGANFGTIVRMVSKECFGHAMRLSFGTVTCVMRSLVDAFNTNRISNSSSSRLLAVVTTFCDFLRFDTKLLEAIATLDQENPEQERMEQEFLDLLVELLNHDQFRYQLELPPNESMLYTRDNQVTLLKETLELNGFLPLEPLFKKHQFYAKTQHAAIHQSHLSPLAEKDAFRVRIGKLQQFGVFLSSKAEFGGNMTPWLYQYRGTFRTTPSLGSGTFAADQTTSFAEAFGSKFGARASTSLSLLPNQMQEEQEVQQQPHQQDADDDDDDLDDEVIVYQPPPGSFFASRRQQHHPSSASDSVGGPGLLPGAATSSAGGDFASAFSATNLAVDLVATSSPLTGTKSPTSGATSTTAGVSSPLGFGAGSSSGVVGSGAPAVATRHSSLGFPEFHHFNDFGNLPDQDLLAGWGNSQQQHQQPPPKTRPPSSSFGGVTGAATESTSRFDSMGFLGEAFGADLAAVERESALYQHQASSLSAFLPLGTLGMPSSSSPPLSAASSPPAPHASPFASTVQSQSLSQSTSTSSLFATPKRPMTTPTRPPPGFTSVTSPRHRETPSPSSPTASSSTGAPQHQFYTRNPFVLGNS